MVGESEKKGKVGPKKKIKRVKEPDVVAKPTGVHIGKAEILDQVKYDTQAAADSHYISFFFLNITCEACNQFGTCNPFKACNPFSILAIHSKLATHPGLQATSHYF